jgi:TIR domain
MRNTASQASNRSRFLRMQECRWEVRSVRDELHLRCPSSDSGIDGAEPSTAPTARALLISCRIMPTEHTNPPESPLYIVHAAADRDIAILLRARIKDLVPDLQVFLASKAGDIPTGEDWLAHIHKNLEAATSFLLLLTPRSIDRHWVWYEAGVAWSRGCRTHLPRSKPISTRSEPHSVPPIHRHHERHESPIDVQHGQAYHGRTRTQTTQASSTCSASRSSRCNRVD